MKANITIVSACSALTLLVVGCGSSPPKPKTETVVTTTTTYTDTNSGFQRRPGEKLYEAPVKTVRAVGYRFDAG